jgi:transcriptional regulator with XRE-family HTH domain
MYENLRAEIARKNMTIVELSNATGIRYQTLSEKLRGNSQFTVKEAKAIKSALAVDLSIDELFAAEVV